MKLQISKSFENGWVVTFPQGTTTAFVPGEGELHSSLEIKTYSRLVVIDGFRRAFDKKGQNSKVRGKLR